MSSPEACADQLAIGEVLNRYAKGLDTFDPALTASCFTDRGRFVIGAEVIVGRPALAEYFDDRTGTRRRHTGLDVETFTHAVTNVMIELHGRGAGVESLVTAYVIGRREGERVMLVRGVRYYDDFEQERGAWGIAERRHVLQWMFEATPTTVGSHSSPGRS
jgi:hypothetical protein